MELSLRPSTAVMAAKACRPRTRELGTAVLFVGGGIGELFSKRLQKATPRMGSTSLRWAALPGGQLPRLEKSPRAMSQSLLGVQKACSGQGCQAAFAAFLAEAVRLAGLGLRTLIAAASRVFLM